MKLGLGMLEGVVVLVLFLAKSCLLVETGVMCLVVVGYQCLDLIDGGGQLGDVLEGGVHGADGGLVHGPSLGGV